VPLLLAALLVRGCAKSRAPVDALTLGSGIRGTAIVEGRVGTGEFVACDYKRLSGNYVCPGILTAFDGMVGLLNDAAPSWAFNTPGIHVTPNHPSAELRLRFTDARLAGTYWTATYGGTAELAVTGHPPREVGRTIVTYNDARYDVAITARIAAPWQFTFVHQDTLMPQRPYLASPPAAAPGAIRSIR
jgi:hypothetical protein